MFCKSLTCTLRKGNFVYCDALPYLVRFDPNENKYSAKPPGNGNVMGQGRSLDAAIEDLEAKIRLSGLAAEKI